MFEFRQLLKMENPNFLAAQLKWPFDPESVSIPGEASDWYKLTIFCPARKNRNIGAGQRAGLITRFVILFYETGIRNNYLL